MTRTALVVDAGPLVAYVDADDRHHGACLDLLASHPGPLVVPILVVAEVAHLVGTRLSARAEVAFIADLAGGAFLIEGVESGDWPRVAQLVARYRDLPLGTVDASVVATAERLGIDTIATLDRRDFSVVRPSHADTFTLVP